jgi:DNA polymerase (family 10)
MQASFPVRNVDIARAFEEIAALLELGDENPFRVRAYRNAASEIETLSFDIASQLAKGEELPKIYGVGEDLTAKIREIAQTRRCRFLEELRGRFPPGITELLTLPGLGPKRVRVLYEKLGIGSAADLQRAARQGRVRELEGFGEKSEKRILDLVERFLLAR